MLVLTTPRLLLRALAPNDAHKILALRSNPEIGRYLGRPLYETMEEAEAFISKIENGVTNREWYFWVICNYEDPANLLGTICLWNFGSDKRSAELGYELLIEAQGIGYAKEASKSVIDFAKEELNLAYLEAVTHKENKASISVLRFFEFEELGFIAKEEQELQKFKLLL